MQQDFRDTLPLIDGSTQDYATFTEIKSYQLIDGRDIYIDDSLLEFSIWNGYRWSKLNRAIPGDARLLDSIAYSKEQGILKKGWNILTGPGVISLHTGLENPYCFSEALCLPFDTFATNMQISHEKATLWCEEHYSAGLVFSSFPQLSIMFSENFGMKADIRKGRKLS